MEDPEFDATGSKAQPAFTVVVPMALQALVISTEFCQGTHQIASIVQPDYSSLIQGPQVGEPKHDLMDSLDTSFWGMQIRQNPRFMDMSTGVMREDRKGIILSWCLPRVYRTAMMATKSALATDEDKGHWREENIRNGYGAPKNAISKEPRFRKAPDRWVVVRSIKGRPDLMRRFFVESNCIRAMDDYEFADAPDQEGKHDVEISSAPAMHRTDDDQPPERERQRLLLRMGRVSELTKKDVEDGDKRRYIEPFNAFAMSHEFFADFQPHNNGVFSIFDDLRGIDEARVDYMVIGFHSSAEQDPLVVTDALVLDKDGKKRGFSNAELMENLKLVADRTSQAHNIFLGAAASPVPRTLTHGLLRNVEWNRRRTDLFCPATTLQEAIYENQPIAIGTHTLDALAAYLQFALDPDNQDSGATVHRLLGQIVMLVARDDDPDSQRQAADETAAQSWLAKSDGTIWQFQEEEKGDHKERHAATLTPGQIKALDSLNKAQRMLDACSRETRQLIQRLYACWWNAAGLRKLPPGLLLSRRQKIRQTGQEVAARISLLNLARFDLQNDVTNARTDFERTLGGEAGLVAVPDAPFGRHQDPTILVAGVKSGWPRGFNEPLPVRLASEIAPVKEAKETWFDECLPRIARPCNSLLREFEEVDAEARARWKANPYSNVEDIAGTQGWFPLFLEWEVEYYHVPFSRWSFEPDAVTGRWRYVIAKGARLSADEKVGQDVRVLQGRSACLPEPGKTLRTRVEQIFAKYLGDPDKGAKERRDEILRRVSDMEYFSSPLAGFADHLLTLRRGPHPLPSPHDKDIQDALGLDSGILSLLKGADHELAPYGASTKLPPTYTSFSPFKPAVHGQARFTKFAIVDKFGQIISGLRPGVYGDGGGDSAMYPCVSPSLACDVLPKESNADGKDYWPNTAVQAEDEAGLCQFFQIPPRINQEARLNANYLQPLAADEASRRVVNEWTNPIWAWLLPNFQNHSIQTFDGKGEFVGEILLDMEEETVTPSLGPNNGGSVTKPPQESRLGLLLEAMLSYKFASPLFNMLAGASDSINSSSAGFDPLLSAALGRPFCVADVGVSIELAAPPRVDESLLTSATATAEPSLLEYEFDVALGNHTAAFDGLVGTFPASGPMTSIASAYTRDGGKLTSQSAGLATRLRPVEFHPKPLKVKPHFISAAPTANSTAAHLTCASVIVDPKCPLWVYSGSLFPVTKVELPRWPVDEAMRTMRAFFSMGPIMVPKKPPTNDVRIQPVPDEGGPWVQMPFAGRPGNDGGWQWVQPKREGGDTVWLPTMGIKELDKDLRVEEAEDSELLEGFVILRGKIEQN